MGCSRKSAIHCAPRPWLCVLGGVVFASLAYGGNQKNLFRSDIAPDACAGIPRADGTVIALVHRDIVLRTVQCLRRLAEPVLFSEQVLTFFRTFEALPGDPEFSSASIEAVHAFFRSDPAARATREGPPVLRSMIERTAREWAEAGGWSPRSQSAPARRLRGRFSARESEEYQILATRFYQQVVEFRALAESALLPREKSFEKDPAVPGDPKSRLHLLRMLAAAARAEDRGADFIRRLSDWLTREGYSPQVPDSRLHPDLVAGFAALSGIPDTDAWVRAGGALRLPPGENPFLLAARARGALVQDATAGRAKMQRYLEFDQWTREIGSRFVSSEVAPGAVRVAFLDSGVDPIAFPHLSGLLSTGAAGRVLSADFADWSALPFVPARWGNASTELSHGSETLTAFLTVLSHTARETIEHKRVDIGVWKALSVRKEALADAGASQSVWSPEMAPFLAIYSAARGNLHGALLPQVVSTSLSFKTQKYLTSFGDPNLIADAPWLWVMSAGNRARDVADLGGPGFVDGTDAPTCFADVPAIQRDDSKIICVGALARGVLGDTIAPYSNFGWRVDLYVSAFQSRECQEGTSCSGPAVAAAVATMLARNPTLSPGLIKKILIGVSEQVELPVCSEVGVCTGQRRLVRVFDPATMLSKALAQAELAAQPLAPNPGLRSRSLSNGRVPGP